MTPDPRRDARHLTDIRRAYAAIAPADWTRAADADGEFIEARGPMGERLLLARLDAGATDAEKAFVVDAPRHVGFLLQLVDRAIAKERKRAGQGSKSTGSDKDYAAEAAMKCQEPAFKAFLHEAHGLERPLTDERVAQRVRSLCGVTSRRELNNSGDAAASWRSLVQQFDAWKRAGR